MSPTPKTLKPPASIDRVTARREWRLSDLVDAANRLIAQRQLEHNKQGGRGHFRLVTLPTVKQLNRQGLLGQQPLEEIAKELAAKAKLRQEKGQASQAATTTAGEGAPPWAAEIIERMRAIEESLRRPWRPAQAQPEAQSAAADPQLFDRLCKHIDMLESARKLMLVRSDELAQQAQGRSPGTTGVNSSGQDAALTIELARVTRRLSRIEQLLQPAG